MRDLVYHPQSGLMLDFAKDDFGGPQQAAIIQAWHDGWRPGPGDLICHFHRNYERPWLYLQQRGGLMIAAHWHNTGLADSHRIVHGMSDEHQSQVEYVQRAGESAGFEAKREVGLPTSVRSDAVIYGSKVRMGVEVQRSPLTIRAAKVRTTKARYAGVEPVWFSDSKSDPSWLGHVPGIRMNPEVPWDTLPGQRSVTVVSGVRVLSPKPCQEMRNGQCPMRRYGCNQWHPDHEPRLNTFVDDLAALVPAGELVPIVFQTLSGRKQVLIFSAVDKERYEAMVEAPADLPLHQRTPQTPQRSGRIDCNADAGGYVETPRCAEHGNFLTEIVPGRLYCRFCHQTDMNARGLGNYRVPGQ